MPRGGGGDWEDWRRQWHMAAALCHAVARPGRAMAATATAAAVHRALGCVRSSR